ncbi:PhzF family phenazine biosynthesis protein [Clostridium botulinum]|uniref:PhzF family phenazine biosynthesis protein n=1 Tax=Clostridium botulinum (strain Hall / ATCC 3502 / NCTC 13319 / Type A) TaxID=441771 RepID=A5I3V3_CLOBH|nr:PhzF family phenazine biosynthesis protein [Clostridium botulinum]ABS33946.1 phenazine biosynthesis protein, PhzF family [Clostridium botulinum A str. ATCC 19397]AUM88355.1 phenazine biosynthesis protein PhzF family [Clostridium botulinum]AWB18045.1 PhzF family phenazine biosynthesis protein [Clostridium botulinum]MBO3439064.1 PhzF family phenazine biosynthesis protein [Clostridium botulinum]MBY6752899.1 PhzF family phenazine biosynthesis protein [Clostridium botulinum]
MEYFHVDVFSNEILYGNGLTVVFCNEELEDNLMLKLTQEFKQFETIFVRRMDNSIFNARIFTVDEELDFAGHPILGAAATIHSNIFRNEEDIAITFQLNQKTIIVNSKKIEEYYEVQMNQGKAEFLCEVSKEKRNKYVHALNLSEENLSEEFPMEVVSTGLPYLLVPLASGIENAKIISSKFEEMLKEVGAKFAYIFDVNYIEGRTWDNQGNVEDVATGSAAGPLGAYLYKHNIFNVGHEIIINQGRFVGRPSKIKVSMSISEKEILVSGEVAILAKGTILL